MRSVDSDSGKMTPLSVLQESDIGLDENLSKLFYYRKVLSDIYFRCYCACSFTFLALEE